MAAAYLRTVSLWIPNSLAMPRRDSPRRLALLDSLPSSSLAWSGLSARLGLVLADPVGSSPGLAVIDVVARQRAQESAEFVRIPATGAVEGSESTRTWRGLLSRDRAVPLLHYELPIETLLDLHEGSRVAGTIGRRE